MFELGRYLTSLIRSVGWIGSSRHCRHCTLFSMPLTESVGRTDGTATLFPSPSLLPRPGLQSFSDGSLCTTRVLGGFFHWANPIEIPHDEEIGFTGFTIHSALRLTWKDCAMYLQCSWMVLLPLASCRIITRFMELTSNRVGWPLIFEHSTAVHS